MSTPACRDHEHPEWWDATVDGETPTARAGRHAKAVEVCGGCQVRDWCRSQVVARVDDGVRGGEVLPSLRDSQRLSPYEDDSETAIFFRALRADERRVETYRAREYRRLRRSGVNHETAALLADVALRRFDSGHFGAA